MIYLVTCGNREFCKIGYTNDVKSRIKEMQVGNPYLIEVVKVIEGDYQLECDIHKKLREFRVRGEWFLYNDYVKNLFSGYEDAATDRLCKASLKESNLSKAVEYAEFMYNAWGHGHSFEMSNKIINHYSKKFNVSGRLIKTVNSILIEEGILHVCDNGLVKVVAHGDFRSLLKNAHTKRGRI